MTSPTPYQLAILAALSWWAPGRMYQGTVPAKVITTRRRRNKEARVSRRANR